MTIEATAPDWVGSPPLRVLVVDDEPLATERLQLLLARLGGVDLVGTASDGESAVRMTRALRPDLLLLDIAMPGMDGIDVARALASDESAAAVVFITAFDHFAVAAFDVAAVDYLMKPVDPARLARAIERTRAYLQSRSDAGSLTSRRSADAPFLEEFWASDLSGLVRIATRDIDRVSAERDYMRLHVGSRSWLIHHSMSALEDGLDPASFVRLHRSAIVRRDF
ncbi:MAG TPA: response regulator transcription factor, partial [Sphingomicrobium sp.]|nr:response regulator transcription factor [Sphingomicrobium sp.]